MYHGYILALSFLLPIIHRLTCATLTSENTTNALILSPTRELCSQLENDAKNLMKGITTNYIHTVLFNDIGYRNPRHVDSTVSRWCTSGQSAT